MLDPEAWSKRLRNELTRDIDALDDVALPEARNVVAACLLEVDDEIRRTGGPGRGVAEAKVLRVVASLSNPRDTQYNALWKRHMTITNLEVRNVKRHGLKGREVAWAGEIRIEAAGELFVMPFEGSYLMGNVTQIETRVGRIVADLMAGIPKTSNDMAAKRELLHLVREALNDAPGVPALLGCPDARSTRIGAHIVMSPEADDDALAERLGVSATLVARVRAQLQKNRSTRWVKRANKAVAAWYTHAIVNDSHIDSKEVALARDMEFPGDVTTRVHDVVGHAAHVKLADGTFRITPCRCGSRMRVPSRFPEMAGLLCLTCGRDEDGIDWQASQMLESLECDSDVLKTVLRCSATGSMS